MSECFPDKTRLAGRILAYLAEHPDAEDTAEGVGGSWLAGAPGGGNATLVKEVLEDLVTQGRVEKAADRERGTLYRQRSRRSDRA